MKPPVSSATNRPRLTRKAAELMPRASEALDEQHQFDATQELATQQGKALARTATGYRVSWLGTTRHCTELHDVGDFVRNSHHAASKST